MRLNPRFRFALYATFSVLVVTGAGWILADRLKDSSGADETWQTAVAYLLMIHGATAMVCLMLLGALVPLHVKSGWRSRRNRTTGATMVSVNAALIVTAVGLYYAGSEFWRPLMSDVHIVLGFCLPALTLVHVYLGRRSR